MTHEHYMQRCFQVARLAGNAVGKNPNVGALLVYKDRIIGEGFHRKFGEAHAEVNAINSVSSSDVKFIPDSVLYVSLEPCNIKRKTPPCADLIIKNKIKKLVVGCEDPNPAIAGSSIDYLSKQGVHCIKDICKEEAQKLISPFRVNVLEERPFVSIKFAQSKDFYLSREGEQTWLSSPSSKIFSHKLRSLHQGILIGNRTAIIDNPALTNRLYSGGNPLRICLDPSNKLPIDLKLFQDPHPTLIINEEARNLENTIATEQWSGHLNLSSLLKRLYLEKNVARLLIEGGSKTISSFIDADLWDEAFIINTNKILGNGIKAPNVKGQLVAQLTMESDKVVHISRDLH